MTVPQRIAATSYRDWLALAAARLPETLAPPASLVPAMRMAAHLPGDCLGGFEIRLGASGTREPVDISVEVSEPRQARELLARVPTPQLRAALADWAEQRIATTDLASFWLEYDVERLDAIDPAAGRIPEPLLIVQPAETVRARWLVADYVPRFLGAAPPARQIARAARAIQRLPPGLAPIYLFALRSRGSDAFRIDTVGTTLAGVDAFVRDVLSPELARGTAAALPLFDGADKVHFSFDVTPDGFGTRIGIEASYRAQPAREPAWRALFDRLVAHELCTAAQRDALLAWPGHDTAQGVPAWPRDGAGAPVRGLCVYALSHLKLSVSAERPLQAKAYLIAKLVRR